MGDTLFRKLLPLGNLITVRVLNLVSRLYETLAISRLICRVRWLSTWSQVRAIGGEMDRSCCFLRLKTIEISHTNAIDY